MKRKIIAALLLALVCGAAACTGGEKGVRIATKPMTEQFILGAMLAALIEQDLGLPVELTTGVGGGTANIHPALLKGEFDLYPEYTGTAWQYVLKRSDQPDPAELLAELRRVYPEDFGLEWVGVYGFNNSYGLAVRKELAERHGLRTFSDLTPYSKDLSFGAEPDFYEREDGYDALCAAYGYKFRKRSDMDIGLKYRAIAGGEIDVMNVFTTDGQLAAGAVSVLEDDKGLYPTYYCGTVVSEDALKKFPGLRATLMKMDGLLTDADMARLNYAVEVQGRNPREAARAYLAEKGLLRS